MFSHYIPRLFDRFCLIGLSPLDLAFFGVPFFFFFHLKVFSDFKWLSVSSSPQWSHEDFYPPSQGVRTRRFCCNQSLPYFICFPPPRPRDSRRWCSCLPPPISAPGTFSIGHKLFRYKILLLFVPCLALPQSPSHLVVFDSSICAGFFPFIPPNTYSASHFSCPLRSPELKTLKLETVITALLLPPLL